MRLTGLEPTRRFDTSTSSWPVYQFQHSRRLLTLRKDCLIIIARLIGIVNHQFSFFQKNSKKGREGVDFTKTFGIIITLSILAGDKCIPESTGAAMEKSPSWSRAHDWKSCRPLKGLEGSNPSFSAIKNPVAATVTGFSLIIPCFLRLAGIIMEAWDKQRQGERDGNP